MKRVTSTVPLEDRFQPDGPICKTVWTFCDKPTLNVMADRVPYTQCAIVSSSGRAIHGPRYGSHYGSNYSTSKGETLFRRGYYYTPPFYSYLSGTGKSHVYEGPAYYVPSERIWQSYVDYRSLPPKSRRDAIHMESEDQWVDFMRKRDSTHKPTGLSITGHPDLYRRNPVPQLLPFRTKAWIRKWDGPGFYYPPSDAWVHEQVGPGIPFESYCFYNEEDWIKFKYMSETPKLEFIKMPLNRGLLARPPHSL